MILQSEAQFANNLGRRSARTHFNPNASASEENSIWEKLSRIFTFGCIETSHNNNGTKLH